jgi:Flp pilus assembly protein TadG
MNAHLESMPSSTRKYTNKGKRLPTRRGASTVELALVLPIFFTLLFTAYEFGRANLMRHGAESAAYEAARAAIVPGANNADVRTAAQRVLASVGVDQFTITTVPANVQTPSNALEVRIAVPLDQNFTISTFVTGFVFTGRCRLSRERL